MSSQIDSGSVISSPIRFYDSTFYTIALTSLTYLVFQIYSIRPHSKRIILFLSFICTCIGSEIFFRILYYKSILNTDRLINLNIVNYFSPTIIHSTILLSITALLWNATQCSALATVLLSLSPSSESSSSNHVYRRWLRHIFIDHIFALLLVRLGSLTDLPTIITLSDVASVCVLTSWFSQVAVFPCVLCFIYSFVNIEKIDLKTPPHPSINVNSIQEGDELNSVLHRLKIIKIIGLALFGIKISALSLGETLALIFATIICLSCLFTSTREYNHSSYSWIFDSFFNKNLAKKLIDNAADDLIDSRKHSASRSSCSLLKTDSKPHFKTIIKGPIHLQNGNEEVLPLLNDQSSHPPTIKQYLEIKQSSSPPPPPSLIVAKQNYKSLSDDELLQIIMSNNQRELLPHNLEKYLPYDRAVYLRRLFLNEKLSELSHVSTISDLPYDHYDYSRVTNQCCENVIGYVQIPVGYAGPLSVDNRDYYIPLATTEGALVASTNRGCKVIGLSGGINTTLYNDGMSRGPVLKFETAREAHKAYNWLDENFEQIQSSFNRTSGYARLKNIKKTLSARYLFIRFVATTGDAMGMNMLSKGVEAVLELLKQSWGSAVDVISISGNYCIDKKPSALNWIDGRGKSVIAEAVIPGEVLENVLKMSCQRLIEVNLAKNMVGSVMAGSIGGFNAHAANTITAMFIACGQDPAQCIASSTCLTWLEATGPDKQDLYISCTMPSLEVGTVGGGTSLSGGQAACLKMLGVSGSNTLKPGNNSVQLAKIMCATVLAAELSLMSALATNDLVKAHLKLNRTVTTPEFRQKSEIETDQNKPQRPSTPVVFDIR
ncbi:unnamed protein product [Didymodactylos carnosus]|uniref:3-hydroxy-3-methylglutaryl coenzyme A reductase n=1 Tax=Didymodactylos carnosus TaxID=1234261 RepID=A0A813RH30_9BILA|nr:unnamed protein product [Didymodactylos carnosus]CAF0902642.1 unnamed protein product [Didymodactylos carnosus]CAF3567428.1 unnamed protein product [Didymodactylos carnosus]CAF3683089.1 unnamed protein product [Didymodactylos carnosus]